MQKILAILLIALYFLPIVLYLDLITTRQEDNNKLAFEKVMTDRRLEELEKDVRILQMDSYINTNGFEGGEE